MHRLRGSRLRGDRGAGGSSPEEQSLHSHQKRCLQCAPPCISGSDPQCPPQVCCESRLEEGAAWRPLSQHPMAAAAPRTARCPERGSGCRPRSPHPVCVRTERPLRGHSCGHLRVALTPTGELGRPYREAWDADPARQPPAHGLVLRVPRPHGAARLWGRRAKLPGSPHPRRCFGSRAAARARPPLLSHAPGGTPCSPSCSCWSASWMCGLLRATSHGVVTSARP